MIGIQGVGFRDIGFRVLDIGFRDIEGLGYIGFRV